MHVEQLSLHLATLSVPYTQKLLIPMLIIKHALDVILKHIQVDMKQNNTGTVHGEVVHAQIAVPTLL